MKEGCTWVTPTRATIEVLRYTSFWLKWFLNAGAPQLKIVGKYAPFILFMIFVVYLGHGIFHPVAFFFLRISFGVKKERS